MFLGVLLADPPLATPEPTSVSEAVADPQSPPLRRYLTRRVASNPHYLDHGVLQVRGAFGWPHIYAVRVHLGVLDHVTLGLQTHWLPDPNDDRGSFRVSPELAVAFIRFRFLDWGAYYRQTMYRPPQNDSDPTTPSFPQVDHWLLSSLSLSNHWLSGGFDFGVVRARIKDPGQDPEELVNPSTIRWKLGGGLHLRAGTRRWGFTASVLAPQLMAEIAFDVRFGLFEMRSKGGWKPTGVVSASDRRVPPWR